MLAYNQKNFLIVDDFSDFRSSVRSMLRDLGAKDIDTADNAEQALKLCTQKRYDFILHDFNLGNGKKNGQHVLEDLMVEKLLSHESVFIMVTAENGQATVMSALEWEPDAYLTKPFNRAGMAQRLEKLIQRKTLLKPILQALDRRNPAEVLAACVKLTQQDQRIAPLCLRYKADALRDLKQYDALETLLRGILADRPVPWAFRALGSLLARRNKVAEAQSVYEQALKAFPLFPALYDGLADVLVSRGESRRAQRVLEDAVRLSPLAIRRQTLLGKLALENQDFDGACRAFRHAVIQGQHSRFKDPENNLNFALALMKRSADNGLDARGRVELNQTLTEVIKDHPHNQGLQARSRLMRATSLLQSDPDAAEKLTQDAVVRLRDMDDFLTPEAALTVADQLQLLRQPKASHAMLKTCAEIYGDDPKVMQSIASKTDDPEILTANTVAIDVNQQGVRLYKAGDLEQAQALFRRAMALQPRNISIALNFAQSLLHGQGPITDPDKLAECQACLKMIGKMPQSDGRFERFQKLQNKAFGA